MGQCYSSKTAVLKTVKHDTNILRIKRKLGDADFTNIVDILEEKVDKSSLDALEERLDLNNPIDLRGNLCQNIDSSDDINATLREYITPLRKTNGYQIISSTIGANGTTTCVNFNDLREISTNPLFDNCIINGDVVMRFPVLEVAPAIFNTLTINGNLYISFPNHEDITEVANTQLGSGTITATYPDPFPN